MGEDCQTVPLDYASYQINLGQFEEAVETLEQWRALFGAIRHCSTRPTRTRKGHRRRARSRQLDFKFQVIPIPFSCKRGQIP
jgi:hypothetical protein